MPRENDPITLYYDYSDALDNASHLAQKEFLELCEKVDFSRPRMARNALMQIVPAIIDKYASVGASVAAEYYETEHELSTGKQFEAVVADVTPLDVIEEGVRYACKYLFDANRRRIEDAGGDSSADRQGGEAGRT